MKRIFTLIVAVLGISFAQAQSPTTEKAKRIIKGERRDYDPNRSTSDEAKTVIRERDRNRQVIYDDRDYRRGESRKYGERSREYGKHRKYDKDRRYDRDREYGKYHKNGKKHNAYNKKRKGNNGKHLGWQKGKGNPHRNRN